MAPLPVGGLRGAGPPCAGLSDVQVVGPFLAFQILFTFVPAATGSTVKLFKIIERTAAQKSSPAFVSEDGRGKIFLNET